MNSLLRTRRADSDRVEFGSAGRIGPLVVKIGLLSTLDATLLFAIAVLLGRGNYPVMRSSPWAASRSTGSTSASAPCPRSTSRPVLTFLVIFQVFVILYTVYIAFTNYSTGHILTKDQAIESLLSQSQSRVPDSASTR